MQSVSLASPLHDPDGRILALINAHGKKLLKLYCNYVFISITPKTIPDTTNKLEALGFKTIKQTEATGLDLGSNYRLALTAASKESQFVHLVDFDRALHWANRYPSELRDIISYLPSYSGFISFMRTKELLNHILLFNAHQKRQLMRLHQNMLKLKSILCPEHLLLIRTLLKK